MRGHCTVSTWSAGWSETFTRRRWLTTTVSATQQCWTRRPCCHRIPSGLHSITGAYACLHHGAGGRPATADRAGPTREGLRASAHRGHHGCPAPRGCFRRFPTPGLRRRRHGPSGLRPTTASSPRQGCATRSSSCARRCIASPPRSTSCGRASAVAQQRRDGPHGASPASRRARAPGHRGRADGTGRPGAVAAQQSGAPRLGPPEGQAAPSAPAAPRAAPGGPSRSPGHGVRGPHLDGRAAEPDDYPHCRG